MSLSIELETERLLLRPVQSQDAQAFFSYRSDAVTNKYQSWIPKSMVEVEAFIERNPSDFNQADSWFQLAIIDQSTNEMIGDIGIHFIDEYQCEYGITLNKYFHRKGIAHEALKELSSYLFGQLNKHRITASIDPENTASLQLFENLGFRKEAHFKESLLINGVWVDDIVYALLKKEFSL